MVKHPIKFVLKSLLFSIFTFCIYLGVLYFIQDNLIFHPTTDYRAPVNFVEKSVKMSDGVEVMTWVSKGAPDKPLLLFFHGNTGQNASFSRHLYPLIQQGYSVVMMEYRGFGTTKGYMEQNRVFNDAKEVYDNLKEQGFSKIIPYGYSFGTSVAINLAASRDVYGLILTAPFSSLKNLVQEKPFPFATWVLKSSYPSIEYISRITVPTLIVHGKKDILIPDHHSKMLYEALKNEDKTLHLLNHETHNSIFFQEKNIPVLLKWLEDK